MKKITAAALSLLILLCGCGQASVENTYSSPSSSVSSQASNPFETPDSSSISTDTEKAKEESDKSSSSSSSSKKSTDSDAKSSSSSSKSTSSKSASSKLTSSKTTSSKNSSSSATTSSKSPVQTTTTGEPETIVYEIGDEKDPIRNVAPEEVQKYITEEAAIVSEPEPEAVYVNNYENLDPGEKVPDSWFDDCVFMGDSLSVGLSMYNDANAVFGDADFICASSLSYWNSQWELYRPGNVHPYYKGQKVLLENAVVLTGAKKAIITLGMNDIGIWGPEGTIDYARSLLYKIRAKTPDVKIYFETVSPMIYSAQRTHLNNPLIRQFNANLEQFAAEEGCGFLNSYDALADSNGNLPYEFCSDPGGLGLHLKFNGCAVWAEFIKANVGSAYPGPEPETDSEIQADTDSSTDGETPAVDDPAESKPEDNADPASQTEEKQTEPESEEPQADEKEEVPKE